MENNQAFKFQSTDEEKNVKRKVKKKQRNKRVENVNTPKKRGKYDIKQNGNRKVYIEQRSIVEKDETRKNVMEGIYVGIRWTI